MVWRVPLNLILIALLYSNKGKMLCDNKHNHKLHSVCAVYDWTSVYQPFDSFYETSVHFSALKGNIWSHTSKTATFTVTTTRTSNLICKILILKQETKVRWYKFMLHSTKGKFRMPLYTLTCVQYRPLTCTWISDQRCKVENKTF